MVIEKAALEVADSEDDSDESLTFSPTRVPNETAPDKLCAMPPVAKQERQDNCQETDCTRQAHVQSNANTAVDIAEGLGGDRNDASLNVDASSVDKANVEFRDTVAATRSAHVPAHITNADIQHQDANRAVNEGTANFKLEDHREVIPVTPHLSVNDNEQQDPAEDDEQVAALVLTSDDPINDAVCPGPTHLSSSAAHMK
ncbi:dna repair swi5 sae3 [Pyrenophora seminiperda CCB06]|uniref:Dna repair swi5 sae3 n=1 Tax=Pyrenophora seminiperda CCB06 TaxID=1302712 RepID=A0A3M7MFC6_9PLEO|nr:dna repair swi5 sae3 [Pyrenophora seminiperda CCB06]